MYTCMHSFISARNLPAETLQQALAININDDCTATHPECVSKMTIDRVIQACSIGVPIRSTLSHFSGMLTKLVRNKVHI